MRGMYLGDANTSLYLRYVIAYLPERTPVPVRVHYRQMRTEIRRIRHEIKVQAIEVHALRHVQTLGVFIFQPRPIAVGGDTDH